MSKLVLYLGISWHCLRLLEASNDWLPIDQNLDVGLPLGVEPVVDLVDARGHREDAGLVLLPDVVVWQGVDDLVFPRHSPSGSHLPRPPLESGYDVLLTQGIVQGCLLLDDVVQVLIGGPIVDLLVDLGECDVDILNV
jgi:hypothetical protein